MKNNKANRPSLTVLVLAGGNFEGKTLGPTPPIWSHPLLLPAGSGLAIEIIRRFYEKSLLPSILKVVVDELPPSGVPIRHLKQENLIKIDQQPHILGSLRASLKAVTTPWVLVNPITTLPSREAELASQVMVGEKKLIRENWSAINSDSAKKYVYEKKGDLANTTPLSPFTGILCAPTKLLSKLAWSLGESQVDDLVSLAEALTEETQTSVVRTQWNDLGHQATHADSRRNYFSSREFNNLHYCDIRDVIVKSSRDNARLTAEHRYLEQLPKQLKRHFPTLIPGKSDEALSLVMEAIPFPSLAELHLHWNIGPNIWLAILDRLRNIQADFIEAKPTKTGSSSWLYSKKLKTRWDQFKKANESNRWWQKELRINGEQFTPLETQVMWLIKELEPLEKHSQIHLIHGDFCFNNILCDPLYTTVKLIDPRGEHAPNNNYPPGYGDSRYDLVKLYHSIGGNYDSIVNNLFKLRWQSTKEIDLEIYVPCHQKFLANAFQELLLPVKLSEHELNVLTASLFFSMLPLHSEDLERQQALAVSGMLLLNHAGAQCCY